MTLLLIGLALIVLMLFFFLVAWPNVCVDRAGGASGAPHGWVAGR